MQWYKSKNSYGRFNISHLGKYPSFPEILLAVTKRALESSVSLDFKNEEPAEILIAPIGFLFLSNIGAASGVPFFRKNP